MGRSCSSPIFVNSPRILKVADFLSKFESRCRNENIYTGLLPMAAFSSDSKGLSLATSTLFCDNREMTSMKKEEKKED
jgi:hypothetical protein